MRKQNKYMFPAGKSRMQPLGIIVFSCIMGTLGFQILLEGMQQLVGQVLFDPVRAPVVSST
jgi:divalent metal cation (Fe/Co/Zn/Cd) transporter